MVSSSFDISTLSPHDLAEMSKNREALFDFRRDLGRRVAEVPAMSSEAERERRLRAAAENTVAGWRKSLPTMSRFAKRFFGMGLLDKSEKSMTDLAKALIPGAPTTTTAGSLAAAKAGSIATLLSEPSIAAGPGLAVALAVYGIKTWQGLKQQEMEGPLRYLSLLQRREATLFVAAQPQ